MRTSARTSWVPSRHEVLAHVECGLGAVGWPAWIAFRASLILVPAVFAFAGSLSIVDGR